VLHLSELDRQKLAHPPLTNVVCQVSFDLSPRASEAKVASAFHEALGGSRGQYSQIASITETSVNLAFGPNAAPSFGQPSGITTGWRLTDEKGDHSVTLMPHSVRVEARAYGGWEDDFGPQVNAALAALEEHIDPVFEQRLGLRYINQVTEPIVSEPADWREWIDPQVLGIVMHDDLGPRVKFARQQVVLEEAEGVRSTLNHGFASDPERDGALTYLVDIDVVREGMRPFDRKAIAAAATDFNSYALRLFQLTVTPALRDHLSQP
jgi:uncharacterized protein (TIGR04255 family)